MRLTWRDGLATLFVGAAVALFMLWLTGAAAAGMSTRVLGAVVFGLGWAACTSDSVEMAVVYGVGTTRRPPRAYVVIASLLGFAALIAGVITLVSGSKAMVIVLMAVMITLWAMSTVRHAITGDAPDKDHATREPLERAA